MKYLREVAKVVTKKRVAKFEVFDRALLNKKDSKFSEFYDAIVKGDIKTDEEAAKLLYQTTPLDDKYRQLKSRFSKRLLNTLFFLNTNEPSFSDYHHASYNCDKNWSQIKILEANGAHNSATKLARKTLRLAQEYHLTEVTLGCARFLMAHFAEEGNEKECDTHNQIVERALVVLHNETQIGQLYHQLNASVLKSKSLQPEQQRFASRLLKKADKIALQTKSPTVLWTYYQIQIKCLEVAGDFQKAIKIAGVCEKFLSRNPSFGDNSKKVAIALFKLECYARLMDYENGRQVAESTMKLFVEGSPEWFHLLESYFSLALSTGNYINAAGLYMKAVNDKRFSQCHEDVKEKWRIFEAYLFYAFKAEELDDRLLKRGQQGKFKIGRFLSEVPTYSKDKRGYNVAILLAQMLHQLEDGDYSGIINRVEALSVYCSRYLRKNESVRSYYFLKMMLTMEKENFDHKRTARKAEKFLTKIKAHQKEEKESTAEWEIIPYETIWGMVLRRLKNRLVSPALIVD